MQWLLAIGIAAVGGVSGFLIAGADGSEPVAPWGEGPPEVSNAFWEKVAVGNAGSSVEPESNCKEIGKQEFRCYARWAPVGEGGVFTYEGTVNVYPDGNIVVSEFSRQAESAVQE
jgi:hypothetical protein